MRPGQVRRFRACARNTSSRSASTSPRDGRLAFVALGPANRVAVVDVKTRQVLKYLLVGQRVWHAAFTPDDKFLLTANGVSNDVSVIDVAALKVMKSVQVGRVAVGIVVIPGDAAKTVDDAASRAGGRATSATLRRAQGAATM